VSDESLRALAMEAEDDELAAQKYARMLRRVPHEPLPPILAELTISYGDGLHAWRKWKGRGPCAGICLELNGSHVEIPPSTRVVLHEADGRFYYFWPTYA
jgi:hypothetical protein